MPDQIARVRSFNRTVTQTIGVLNDHYLGRGRPLGECRLLFEIGEGGAEVAELRARLELDSGYLSRLLRSLERQGLIETGPSAQDRRARRATLTPTGAAELAQLNLRSDRHAQSMLAALNDRQRAQLVEAMGEVERLLSASAVRIEQVSPTSNEAEYCLSHYFRELAERFERGFDPARSLAPTLDDFCPPHGAFLVMRLHGEPVGCGGFKLDPPDAAYIKRMWVSPNARGLGLGRSLLQELEQRARALGYCKLQLETEKALVEAQQLYRSSGFCEVPPFNAEPYADHWFEKDLT